MSSGTWKGALDKNLAWLGNYNSKGAFDFNYKWKISSWKVKEVGGLPNAIDDSFGWKWQLRGNCGEMSCIWRNWVFHWFMHSKQIYEPRETVGIFLSPEITLLPTKPLLPYYPLGIPWVTKIISGFAGFLMAFCWKTKHTPWLSHMSAKVLFSRLQKDTSRP